MRFLTPLLLQADDDDLNFTLLAGFVAELSPGVLVTVPAGYETDLASVPRLLWWLFPPHGKYRRAAVVHDYIYTHLCHRFSRSEADDAFRRGCLECGCSRLTARVLHAAVRLGGRGGW